MNGLAYFKEVYDEVPGWVQKMHDYNPAILDHYTAIRSVIMNDSVLSRKEKDVLISVMNAGRKYERSMLYHTKGAVDFGCTFEEIVEYLLVAYAYAGSEALPRIALALRYAQSLKGIIVSLPEAATDAEYIKTFQHWLKDNSSFIDQLLAVIEANGDIQQAVLADGAVPSSKKYLAMVGCYITELNGAGVASWMEQARTHGVSEAELAEVGYLCILTAGIPSWFELSDHLIEQKK